MHFYLFLSQNYNFIVKYLILILDAKKNTTEIPDKNKSHEKTTKKFDVLVEIIFVIGERFMGVFQYGHFPHYNWTLQNFPNIAKIHS